MSRPVPREVYIEPTNRCNELCQTCPRTFFTREPEADLDLERFLGILDQFPDVERVVLHGVGEPLLARDLPAMVAEANRRGARVLFNTNALALHRRLAERLVAAGLDELRISMDAADRRTYLAIRGVDGYEKAMRRTADFCRLLRELQAERPQVSLVFMAMRESIAELPAVIERAGAMGVRRVVLQRLVHFGTGLATEPQSLMGEDLSAVLADCRTAAARWGVELAGTGGLSPAESLTPVDARRPWSGCTRPWRSTYVTANGNVLPCCFAPFTTSDYDGVVLGNVFERPMEEIWNGSEYEAFRRAHASDEPPECCRGCGTRWMY
ncbi:MAG TPA: radical SAM protein [Candidatus Dormibacteraeota bacterium]|nr:radical SAM protein [Candidatus Dormibacteraeota bacterium]